MTFITLQNSIMFELNQIFTVFLSRWIKQTRRKISNLFFKEYIYTHFIETIRMLT